MLYTLTRRDRSRPLQGGRQFLKSGNEALATALSKWVFRETGVLRAGNVKHHKKGETQPPSEYTVTEQVVREPDTGARPGYWSD